MLVLHRLNAYYGRQVSWPAVKIVRRHPLFPIKAGCFSQGFFTHNPHSFVIRSLTPLMYLPLILFASLCPMAVLAANNCTEPCHAGECQWDLQSTHASGTMLLVSYWPQRLLQCLSLVLMFRLQAGSNSSISDLTPAGGWTIIDCNATSADQEIRVVCHDPSKCNHLHMNGAENTVVRLPDEVGVLRLRNHCSQLTAPSTSVQLRALCRCDSGLEPYRSVDSGEQAISVGAPQYFTDVGAGSQSLHRLREHQR